MSTSQRPEAYVLSRERFALDVIESDFADYLKLRSICWLLRNGVPSTEGIVLRTASAAAIDRAVEYARGRGWQKFMLRHDSPAGQGRSIQGGFLIGLDEIGQWSKIFVSGGVCILLEPLDAMRNGYNMNCIFDGASELIEVVGPGFDASDLQRGQTIPHERAQISFRDSSVQRLSQCNQEEYDESVAERECKVWWKFIRRELDQRAWRHLTDAEREACRAAIVNYRGEQIPAAYEPAPDALLAQYASTIRRLVRAWVRDTRECPAVVAASYVQDGSLRIWDVNTSTRWTG